MSGNEMTTGYYDTEAGSYDESRGGEDRARAAAAAIAGLLSSSGASQRGLLLDVAGGTGAVSALLGELGWTPAVIDLSGGMLAVAAKRMPGRAVLASADRLPIRPGSIDLVTVIWMLNLVPIEVVDAVIADAARVLRPGGHLVVTVDKELAHDAAARDVSDADARVSEVAAAAGLERTGTATFSGRSPWGSVTDADPQFRLAAFRRRAPGP